MRAQEDRLFDSWRASLPDDQQRTFVTDGAVDPVAYDKSALKILLLLKEVNDRDGGGWCLRSLLGKGERADTWNVVTRWLRAIRNLQTEIRWSELENVTYSQRVEELRSIAAMNFKKIPGHHTTHVGTWWSVVNRDKDYIRQQFELYQADLVLCCGSIVADAFDVCIKSENMPEWQQTSRGVEYLQYVTRKFVIAYSHPEARVAPNLLHYGLVDAVREIFLANPGAGR